MRWFAFFLGALTCAVAAHGQDSPVPQTPAPEQARQPTQPPAATPPQASQPAQPPATPPPQPKRILGVVPNFRAVSAGAIPPPPGPKESFKIATSNTFDYSAFVFVGVTSALAEWTDAHPKLGEGMPGFGRYYWRGFVDKADGNYLVVFVFPTFLHEDERYFAMGQGPFLKRTAYAASRVVITPNYHGNETINLAEILGRGISQGISASYYPPGERTLGDLAVKFGYAVGRDALMNVFREFWPDIAVHVLHRHP